MVKVLDLDPQGWWFDPWCVHDKICSTVGPLSNALHPTLLQRVCLLLSLINCKLLWIKASDKCNVALLLLNLFFIFFICRLVIRTSPFDDLLQAALHLAHFAEVLRSHPAVPLQFPAASFHVAPLFSLLLQEVLQLKRSFSKPVNPWRCTRQPMGGGSVTVTVVEC